MEKFYCQKCFESTSASYEPQYCCHCGQPFYTFGFNAAKINKDSKNNKEGKDNKGIEKQGGCQNSNGGGNQRISNPAKSNYNPAYIREIENEKIEELNNSGAQEIALSNLKLASYYKNKSKDKNKVTEQDHRDKDTYDDDDDDDGDNEGSFNGGDCPYRGPLIEELLASKNKSKPVSLADLMGGDDNNSVANQYNNTGTDTNKISKTINSIEKATGTSKRRGRSKNVEKAKEPARSLRKRSKPGKKSQI